MYELVNTSLPNGLIAGTHGFATVAMTKGLPDVLRNRLEALCAYNHRTSAHDQTYWNQNPVNWFHVILPQGEHVSGCVAPADFDYTGRTNRLAKLRIFASGEMPIVGAAEILRIEKNWYRSTWQGEPCYLQENKAVCGVLRMQNPKAYSSALAWDELFGANGFRLAQQFAWQLEKNISGGGKPIYFKSSATFDLTGERLLGLFADLINLLPVEFRARVTFSTYPAAMPNGFFCHLRGVYDSDKIFEINSSVAPWIDCENARVVHPEMLPVEGSKRANLLNGDCLPKGVKPSGTVPLQRATTAGDVTASAEKRQYYGISAPKKQGADMFVISMIVAIVGLLLGAGIFFYWMISDTKKQMVASVDSVVFEDEVKKETEDLNVGVNNLPQVKTNDVLSVEKKNPEPEKENREIKEVEKIRDERNKKAAEKKAREDAEAVKRKEQEAKEARAKKEEWLKFAFQEAKCIYHGRPLPESSLRKEDKAKKAFGTNDECRVYFYSQGVLTNAAAGFVKIGRGDPKLRWGSEYKVGVKELEKKTEGVVLWYNTNTKNCFWDLNLCSPKMERWFAYTSAVDLNVKYFGPDSKIKELYERIFGNVQYEIHWKYNGKEGLFSVDSGKLQKSDVCKILGKGFCGENEIANLNEEIQEKEREKENEEKEKRSFENEKRGLEDIEQKIGEINGKIGKEKQKKNKNKKEKEELEKNIKSLIGERDDILHYGSIKKEGERPKKPKFDSYRQFNEKLTKMRTRSWNDANLKRLIKEIENLKKKLKKIEDKEKKIEENIQNVFFSVSVKNRNGESETGIMSK